MQIVAQLEHSLGKERDRLQAMMAHLHLTKEANSKSNESQHRKPSSILDRNNERSQSEGPPSHSISPPPPVSSMDTTRPKVFTQLQAICCSKLRIFFFDFALFF